jgi:hypothetical protein
VKITLYTVEKANHAIQELTPRVQALVELRARMKRIDTRMEVMSLALAGASPGNPDATESRQLATERQELVNELREGLGAIQARGCIVKDLDTGLLDFYSLHGDRLVFLCWKLGETEIGHWHTLDGGFATRRPIDQRSEDPEGR